MIYGSIHVDYHTSLQTSLVNPDVVRNAVVTTSSSLQINNNHIHLQRLILLNSLMTIHAI